MDRKTNKLAVHCGAAREVAACACVWCESSHLLRGGDRLGQVEAEQHLGAHVLLLQLKGDKQQQTDRNQKTDIRYHTTTQKQPPALESSALVVCLLFTDHDGGRLSRIGVHGGLDSESIEELAGVDEAGLELTARLGLGRVDDRRLEHDALSGAALAHHLDAVVEGVTVIHLRSTNKTKTTNIQRRQRNAAGQYQHGTIVARRSVRPSVYRPLPILDSLILCVITWKSPDFPKLPKAGGVKSLDMAVEWRTVRGETTADEMNGAWRSRRIDERAVAAEG